MCDAVTAATREGQTMEGNPTSKECRKREMSCISSIIHTESQWSEGEARGHRGGGVMTYKGEDDEEEQNE